MLVHMMENLMIKITNSKMKYLKRIKRCWEYSLIKEYIDNCFIEFADQ
jgi:hypothetical protein